METRWYAVYTKPRWEKRVAETLSKKDIQNYCPLNKVVRQWHDRKKIILEPIFTSYVFINIADNQFAELKKIDGILSVLHWLGKPAIIRDNEIEAIRSFLNEHEQVLLEKVNVQVDDNVKILHGPLNSREGIVIEVLTQTVKLLLPSLGYSMMAQVHRSDIKVIAPVLDNSKKKSGSINSYG